jgi:hypothetical protein
LCWAAWPPSSSPCRPFARPSVVKRPARHATRYRVGRPGWGAGATPPEGGSPQPGLLERPDPGSESLDRRLHHRQQARSREARCLLGGPRRSTCASPPEPRVGDSSRLAVLPDSGWHPSGPPLNPHSTSNLRAVISPGKMYQPVTPLPAPMLLRSSPLPTKSGYAFEPKWDGFRALVSTVGPRLVVRSRRRWDMTERVPELCRPAGWLPVRRRAHRVRRGWPAELPAAVRSDARRPCGYPGHLRVLRPAR